MAFSNDNPLNSLFLLSKINCVTNLLQSEILASSNPLLSSKISLSNSSTVNQRSFPN